MGIEVLDDLTQMTKEEVAEVPTEPFAQDDPGDGCLETI